MSKQPKALRLAGKMEDILHDWMSAHEAATELRRLHEVNTKLVETLKCVLDCSDHQNPEVWTAAVKQARAALAKAGEQA